MSERFCDCRLGLERGLVRCRGDASCLVVPFELSRWTPPPVRFDPPPEVRRRRREPAR